MNRTEKLTDREKLRVLEDQVKRDSMTGLYNHFYGKELMNEYLIHKTPYSSCGMLVVDIDYFKAVNDTYGHLFGDQVLITLARLFERLFRPDDIIMRAGGDEFVILLKDIRNAALVKRATELVETVRELKFGDSGYSMTCSVGVCFLPENQSGYTYDQLFENADWALYKAKEDGKNRCAFCDHLQRFEMAVHEAEDETIDARYLRNDVIATAFEIFEKTSSFSVAIELLLKIIGIRFQLDRITIVQTDIKQKKVSSLYQWVSERAPDALQEEGGFTKEDFLTLFHSYDEFGTTVLQYDDLCMYSESAAKLLVQGDAKTTVYAAMYCEGKYTGAISYVVCGSKRFWSRQQRRQLGELTKIISAHLAKNQMSNEYGGGVLSSPEFDSLTGLLSFSRFREEAERLIVGGNATSHLIIYTDFEDFKYFNRKYGYRMGDQVLRDFSSYIMETLENGPESYFTRVVADQFILFTPYFPEVDIEAYVQRINDEFCALQAERFPGQHIRLRSGIYVVETECSSAAEGIDAANYARRQVRRNSHRCVRCFDDIMRREQKLEADILNGFNEALVNHRFQIYLQPKYSMKDYSVVGAEALIRWIAEDGAVLNPNDFIPMFEENKKVLELDFYVFEQIAAFLQKNDRMGRKQYPISVNASVLHASDPGSVNTYQKILHKYGVSPELLEIELTETASASEYKSVKHLIRELRGIGLKTALDDFGAGYSMLNVMIDICVDTVKIDKEFVKCCTQHEKGLFFLQHIIALMKGMGYAVVCEGVETSEQAELLKNAGCEEAQGYLFARPMSIPEYEKLVYGG